MTIKTHILSRKDIRHSCDDGSYNRGVTYFEQGRVSGLKVKVVNDNEIMLFSAVQGSYAAAYQQQIQISGFDSFMVQIEGECTCPVAYNCKHVVAACLSYQADKGLADVQPSSLHWLEEFTLASQPPPAIEADGEFIVYILVPTAKPSILQVQIFITRLQKNGRIRKGRRTELHHLSNPYMRSNYAQNVDKEIGEIIGALSGNLWGQQNHSLQGELGFLALSKIVNTQRCFWGDTDGPTIQPGPARELQLDWQDAGNGDRRFVMQVQPTATLLSTAPALYLDVEAGVIGPITGADFNAQQWEMLLEMPILPREAKHAFTEHLVSWLPDTPLPPPDELQSVEISEQLPTPKLTLFAQQMTVHTKLTHFVRISFLYNQYEVALIPQRPQSKLIRATQIITIHRDLAAETSALDTLEQAGFSGFEDEQNDAILFAIVADSGLMEAAACWQHFLSDVLPDLQENGWLVEFDPSFQLQFVDVEHWEVEIESDNEWFDLRFDLDVQGQKLPLLPLITDLLANYTPDQLPETLTLPLGDSRYLQLPAERIRAIFQTLYELYDTKSLDNDGALRLNRYDAARLSDLEASFGTELQWRGGAAMRKLGRKLKDFQGIANTKPPRGLQTELRDYQQQGLNWLQFLRSFAFNGILADDMGLGKTVQTLAHLLVEKEKRRLQTPCLIIAPTSLVSNWRREAQKFTPKLSVLVLQGPDRKQHFAELSQYDLIISTYPLLARDHEQLKTIEYHYLILDEAQVIKNPRAKAAQVAREICANHRLCLTGTPMENHLGELWALFDFLMPGFLGENKFFTQRFRTPIEKHGDDEQRQRLVRRVLPFLLRRTKNEVIQELPPKTEIIRSVALESQQAALYESIRLSMEKKVRAAIAQKGLARSHITILDALLKLRQTCCDPQLLSLAQAAKVKKSAKMEMLMEMVPELLEEGRRILIFSQFTKMLGLIEQRLQQANITYTKLTGQTRKRDEVIERFRQGEVDVFLISLKAGGVGLNLTEADTVIHYDPWWNPAVENQATDRTHRIGQNKPVFVYKLITENTLEEKILSMQARKQALADGVYQSNSQGKELSLTSDDLQTLFAPLGDSD